MTWRARDSPAIHTHQRTRSPARHANSSRMRSTVSRPVVMTKEAARLRADRRLFKRYRRDRATRWSSASAAGPRARAPLSRSRRAAGGTPRSRLGRTAQGDRPRRSDRQTALSAFAVPTILGELRRHFRDRGWSVRDPQELALRVQRATDELTHANARSPHRRGDRPPPRQQLRAGARSARGGRRPPRPLARGARRPRRCREPARTVHRSRRPRL